MKSIKKLIQNYNYYITITNADKALRKINPKDYPDVRIYYDATDEKRMYIFPKSNNYCED